MDFSLFIQSLPELFAGSWLSICIACGAAILGFSGGVLLMLGATSNSIWMRALTKGYVTLIQGTPMLLQICVVFYALPQLGLKLSPMAAALVAIGGNSAAYMSQVFLSGLRAVHPTEERAARSMGMSRAQVWRHLKWPQIWRAALPSLGNELVTLIKDSSLASVIGVVELTKVGNQIRGRTLDAWTSLVGVCAFYFVMTLVARFLLSRLTKRSLEPCSL